MSKIGTMLVLHEPSHRRFSEARIEIIFPLKCKVKRLFKNNGVIYQIIDLLRRTGMSINSIYKNVNDQNNK